jgi:hypothetical protein
MKVYHRQIQTATGAPGYELPAFESIMRDLSSGTLDHLSEKEFVQLAKKAQRIFAESKDLFSVRQLHSKVYFELKSCEQELTAIRQQGPTKKAEEFETKLQHLARKEAELRAKLLLLAA